MFWVGRTGSRNDLVQFQQQLAVSWLAQSRRQLGEIHAIATGGEFIQQLSQAIKVSPAGTWTFRWNEAFSPDKAARIPGGRHQPNIGQLGLTADKDDVAGLNVAVNETVGMQVLQAAHQLQGQGGRVDWGKPAPPG